MDRMYENLPSTERETPTDTKSWAFLIMRSIFDTILVLSSAKLVHSKLDRSDWQRLTYDKACHMLLMLIPIIGGSYGDNECIFARSDEKLG